MEGPVGVRNSLVRKCLFHGNRNILRGDSNPVGKERRPRIDVASSFGEVHTGPEPRTTSASSVLAAGG